MDIATLVRRCLGSFADAANLESNDLYTTDQIHDESGRFRIWAGNVSAHTTGRRSLQHRLRDSPELSSAVAKYLHDLLATIENMKLSSSHNNENLSPHLQGLQTGHTSIDVDDGNDYDEEDEDLFGDVVFSPSADGALEETREIISCLFRLSMAFRNPARNDEIRHASTAGTSFYEPHDIQHVNSKFPSISAVLSEKLGIAISRRRQYLKYREEHHQKLASDHDHTGEDTSTVVTSLPSAQQRLPTDTYNTDTESLYTATSYALAETGDSLLRLPERPKTATDDMPFECPLCYHIVMASDEKSWRQHVHEDLLPYVCLYEDCTTAVRQYAHRREWRRHMESHEKHWLCPYGCSATFGSSEGFERHLEMEHLVEEPMIATLCKACASKPVQDTPRACTLCKQPILGSDFWFRHVGYHLEQLALFGLPGHLLSSNSDNIQDVVSSVKEVPAHDLNADDTTEPPLLSLIVPGDTPQRHVHPSTDLNDPGYLPENLSSGQSPEQEMKNDGKDVVRSHPAPPPQDQDTRTTNRLPSQGPLVPTDNQLNLVTPELPEDQYECRHCSARFRRSYDLKSHLRIHSQEKAFVCQTCDARFRRLHDLIYHANIHTDERPLACDKCGRKFALESSVAKHKGGPFCLGRKSGAEDEFVDKKGMGGLEYPEEDLDMYEAIEVLDSGDHMSAGRRIKFPRIDDI